MNCLICYDGSSDAQAAIDHAGRLMPGAAATVLVIWEPLALTGSLNMSFGMVSPYGGEGTYDGVVEKAARDTAGQGAQRALGAGLVPEPRAVERRDDIATDILAVAHDIDADVIVLGTRGRGGMKSLMLGSVSNAVLHHADRPVLVIPSPALAEERRHWAAQAHVTADFT